MSIFFIIRHDIENSVQQTITRQGYIKEQGVRSTVSRAITECVKGWRQIETIDTHSISMSLSRKIANHYREAIEKAINIAFGELPISRRSSQHLFEIARHLFCKHSDEDTNSGVVFAGFGEKEIFPSFIPLVLDGIFNNRLKYTKLGEPNRIGIDSEGVIAAFAQREMAARFMEGVDPLYLETEQGFMSELPNRFAEEVVMRLDRYNDSERQSLKQQLVNSCNEIVSDFQQQMSKLIEEQFTRPITDVVSLLPKPDLGKLAEALVNLSSIKRRFSRESETVAEPIDVAVISKGDGFIWIKRKHYFQPDLNPGFFTRRYKGVSYGNKEKK